MSDIQTMTNTKNKLKTHLRDKDQLEAHTDHVFQLLYSVALTSGVKGLPTLCYLSPKDNRQLFVGAHFKIQPTNPEPT